MLSLENGWLFVHVPKTGGDSLQAVLAPHGDDRLLATPPRDGSDDFEVSGAITPAKHASLSEYRELLPPDLFASLFTFAIVRDPWQRAISQYFDPIRWPDATPNWSQAAFLALLDEMPSAAAMTSIGGEVALDMTLRFESLQEDAERLLDRLGLPRQQLPHRNRGLTPRPWSSYYAGHPELLDAVAERFADDVAAFGYAPPPIRPTARARLARTSRRAGAAATTSKRLLSRVRAAPRLGPTHPAVDIGDAMLATASALVEDAEQLFHLRDLVGRGGDLSGAQWLQLYATTLSFAPDLVVELGRGYGNSTTVFVQASHRLGGVPVVSVGYDFEETWRMETAPRLRGELGATWDAAVELHQIDISRLDFAPIFARGRRILLFWDAHGRRLARRIIRSLLSQIAERENLVAVHDVTDGRYLEPDGIAETIAGRFHSPFEEIASLHSFLSASEIGVETPAESLRRARESRPEDWAALVAALPSGFVEKDLLDDSHWICFSVAAQRPHRAPRSISSA